MKNPEKVDLSSWDFMFYLIMLLIILIGILVSRITKIKIIAYIMAIVSFPVSMSITDAYFISHPSQNAKYVYNEIIDNYEVIKNEDTETNRR